MTVRANAVDSNGSYFVWIPRYAYRITYYSNSQYTKVVGYCDGRGIMKLNEDNTLTRICTSNTGIRETANHYIVAPAFSKDTASGYRNGGWDYDLPGFWTSKYEMSMETNGTHTETINSDIGNVQINEEVKAVSKPCVSSWRNINIRNCYLNGYNYDRNIFNNIKPPYISIIVPIYNIGKEYLVNCLNSLVNQTLKEIEIILVNDCSPNEEDDLICKEYALKDKRIKYIKHKENKGSGGARMTGLKEANGYAIGFVDPDDTVNLNTYEIAVSKMIFNNVDIVCFNWFIIDQNYNISDVDINIPKFVYGKDIINLLSIERMHACVLDKIYKKELLDKLGYDFMPEKISSQDMVANFKIFSIANSLEYITKQLYHYKRRNNSITGKLDNKFITDKYIAIDNI